MKYSAILIACILIHTRSRGQGNQYQQNWESASSYDSVYEHGGKKANDRKTRHFNVYTGASVMQPSGNKKLINKYNRYDKHNNGMITFGVTVGGDIYVSDISSIGGYFSTFSYGQRDINADTFYMLRPAMILGVKLVRNAHTSSVDIPFNICVGYLRSFVGNWRYTDGFYPNTYDHVKGVEVKLGMGFRKQVYKALYMQGDVNYNIISGVGTASSYYMGRQTIDDPQYSFLSNYLSLTLSVGLSN